MKNILVSLSFILMLSLQTMAQNTAFSGQILAATGDSAFLQFRHKEDGKFVVKRLGAAKLDDKGRFAMKFQLDSALSAMFFDGNEVTMVYLLPGDDIKVTLHTSYFDETVRFSGKGGDRNNAIAALAIADEMNWMPLNMEENLDDTVALFKMVDDFTEKIVATMSDYKTLYPEMAEHLEEMKAQKQKGAERQRASVRERIAFKEYVASMKGKPLTDIVGIGLDGEQVSLSSFKGKTTVVDFWATWCGPCKAEMPHLSELEKEYGDNVNFVSVGVWCEEDGWKEMAKALGLSHNMYLSKENTSQLEDYKVQYIPRYMVIDKNLNIVSIDAPRPSSGKLQGLF